MKNTRNLKTLLSWSTACLLLIGLLPGASAGIQGQAPPSGTQDLLYVFLPLSYRDYPPPPPPFGVQMNAVNEANGLTKAVEGGVYWVRLDAFDWDRIEPQRTIPASYDWQAVDEASLRSAYENGLTVLGVVRFAPEWAQKYPGSACGPIDPGQLDRYAAFLTALVRRYKAPPYHVRHWELGNEPDMTVTYQRRGYGCWGEEGQATFGGAAYGEMLKVAYPAIKAADPQAQVLIGGLLLDCDPAHPPAGKTCASSRFLEGILDAGAGHAFDVVSYHGYAHWDGADAIDENNPYWQARGGVVLGKARYLREVLARYGIDKPLMLTEASLIYTENTGVGVPPDDTFYNAQADYVARLYVRNWANDIQATIWFTLQGPGWRYGSLLDAQQAPKPAYHAYRFLTDELKDAWYEGPVTRYANLEGYAFGRTDRQIWVLWPPQHAVWNISLPAGVTRVYDVLGQDITPPGTNLTLSRPVYIEFAR